MRKLYWWRHIRPLVGGVTKYNFIYEPVDLYDVVKNVWWTLWCILTIKVAITTAADDIIIIIIYCYYLFIYLFIYLFYFIFFFINTKSRHFMWIADDSHEISKLFLKKWNVVCYKFCLVLKELTIEWRRRGSSGRRRSRPACAYTQFDQGPQSLRTDFLDQTWQIATAKTMQTQIMLGDNSPNMTSVQEENVHCCRTRSANGPSSTEKCVFEHVQKTLIPTHFVRKVTAEHLLSIDIF